MTASFEEQQSSDQSLSFRIIEGMLKRSIGKIPIAVDGLMDEAGRFTNLAYVLSDQCPWHIVMEVDGKTMELDGPILKQLDDAMDLMCGFNPGVSVGRRIGAFKRYPTAAFKEGLINAVIHCDLSMMKNIGIKMEEGLISIVSPGGVIHPSEWTDISSTNPRNWKLAQLLVRMKRASLKGQGLFIMKGCYNGSGMIPCIIETEDSFTLQLPALDNRVKDYNVCKDLIMDRLSKEHGLRIGDLSSNLLMSVHNTKKVVSKMEEEGIVFTMGLGAERRIFLMKSMTERTRLKVHRIR